MGLESNFKVGDAIKVKDSAWEDNFITLNKFGFQQHASYEVSGVYPDRGISLVGNPSIYYPQYFELSKSNTVYAIYDEPSVAPIKSDGGSSSYYDIELPMWLIQVLTKRADQGRAFIKTEELIEVMFKSDFDYANIQKALVRSFGAQNGGGKEGNDVDYEQNKIQYSSNRIKERSKR